MTPKRDFVLYVDFDSTLYDTERFKRAMVHLIAQAAKVDETAVEATLQNFVAHPGLGGYDFAKHVLFYSLKPEVMWRKLDALLVHANYLYPDSTEFIKLARSQGFEPQILSFGEKRLQMAKITPSLPMLAGHREPLGVTVVNQRKHLHIQTLHRGQSGALIDDVPDQKLPEGFTEIHIDRNLRLTQPITKADGYTVANLLQALEIVEQAYDTSSTA